MIHQGNARYPVREIIIHCAATRPDWMQGRPLADKVAEIRRWHVQGNGWKDIGYHWVIDRNGDVMTGRAENVVGAHTAGRNSGTIGVCLLGGHGSNENDRFDQHFTAAQDRALRGLIEQIKARTDIQRVTGHNQFAAKACPGFRVATWLAGQGPAQPKPAPAPAPVQPAATPTLRRGSRGEDVRRLQGLLSLTADGAFGPATESAVRAFQRSHELTADGIVGPMTWRALTTPAPAAPEPQQATGLLASFLAFFTPSR